MGNGIWVRDMCKVRRMERHGREILSGSIVRSVLVGIEVGYVVVAGSG